MTTQLIEENKQTKDVCCGGPAPAGISACCVKDVEAKADGKAGCGCSSPTTQADEASSCGGDSRSASNDLIQSRADLERHDEIRQAVRTHYSQVAQREGSGCGAAGSPCCGSTSVDANTLSLALGYSASETGSVPEGANLGLGCGNPQAIASLKPGEIVVDLGRGAGFDCFLASRQVGDNGRVIGVDMTPAMVSKARANAAKGNYRNVEFRLGEIESLPIADATVDAIISNCVINLSPDKQRVFAESYRVLKPGGRLAIADIVAFGEPPEAMRRDMALLTGCMAGASPVHEIEAMLETAGFERIRVAPKNESKSFIRAWAPNAPITDYIVSATIEAVKLSA